MLVLFLFYLFLLKNSLEKKELEKRNKRKGKKGETPWELAAGRGPVFPPPPPRGWAVSPGLASFSAGASLPPLPLSLCPTAGARTSVGFPVSFLPRASPSRTRWKPPMRSRFLRKFLLQRGIESYKGHRSPHRASFFHPSHKNQALAVFPSRVGSRRAGVFPSSTVGSPCALSGRVKYAGELGVSSSLAWCFSFLF